MQHGDLSSEPELKGCPDKGRHLFKCLPRDHTGHLMFYLTDNLACLNHSLQAIHASV